MISVTEAKELILQHCTTGPSICVRLEDAHGKILSEDVYSRIDMPPFSQSSVDGYAFNFSDWSVNKKLKISGEIAAGDNTDIHLPFEKAVRIFTGAPVPHGADTVVMQEKIAVENDILSITDEALTAGINIRLRGAEIKAGDLALEKGSRLNPAAIGFLACIGVSDVVVYAAPVVSLLVTGNELQKPGLPLLHGQVYESNSFTLRSALLSFGIDNVIVFEAKDNLDVLTHILQTALQQSDIVLLTGGVSVGDYDFVVQAAENCGVKKIFHKVKQKPGKPLYFGKKENKMVFGLPGNPSSVLTCFYQYVILVFQVIKKDVQGLQQLQLPLQRSISKAAGLTHFLKGYFTRHAVIPLTGQESFRMRSFTKANCFIEVDANTTYLNKDDLVTVYLLPGC